MPPEQILRIHREDQQGGIVFVNVSSNGPLPLDLKLLATDGVDPFVLNRKLPMMASTDGRFTPTDGWQLGNIVRGSSVEVLANLTIRNGKVF